MQVGVGQTQTPSLWAEGRSPVFSPRGGVADAGEG